MSQNHMKFQLPFHQKRFLRRGMVAKKKPILKFSQLFSESTKREFQVFFPFGTVLLIVVLIFSLLIQLVYLDPLYKLHTIHPAVKQAMPYSPSQQLSTSFSRNQLSVPRNVIGVRISEKIWTNYQMYLNSIGKAQRITLILTYQQVTTPIQTISGFLKRVLFDPVDLADLVPWSPDGAGSYTTRDLRSSGVQNFRGLNEMRGADICSYQQYYQTSPTTSYAKEQYFGWLNWQESRWESITEEQREYLIKNNAALAVAKSLYAQQNNNNIVSSSYYIARQSDDTWLDFTSNERLNANRFWNAASFGGPFNCDPDASGNIKEFVLPSPDYLAGKTQGNAACVKDTNQECVCKHLSVNRNFPQVWRCRPWYVASAENEYITFADAYEDVNSGSLITTVSFKLIDDALFSSIDDQRSATEYAIYNFDLDIGKLQKNYGNGNVSTEYQYFVAPKTYDYDNDNGGYYEFTTFLHPKMNGTKASIIDLEFMNSTNAESEIAAYKARTAFMMNSTIRSNGCNLFKNSSGSSNAQTSMEVDGIFATDITKNNTEFYTIFSEIRVCYGNLMEQKSLVVGYLASAITKEKKYEITTSLRESLADIQKIIIAVLVIVFVFCFVLLYLCMQRFLQCNFEEPIQILSSVILESGPQEVHKLNSSVQKGEIRMQLELKNLLSAIDSVVISVQTKVQQDLEVVAENDQNQNENQQQQQRQKNQSSEQYLTRNAKATSIADVYQKQALLFNSALTTFLSVEHKIGMGLCFNNIGNIFLQQENYETALKFYKQAFLLSQEQFYDELNQKRECDMNQIEILCSDHSKRSVMKIYASRKYQIACALIKYVNQEETKKHNEFAQTMMNIISEEADEPTNSVQFPQKIPVKLHETNRQTNNQQQKQQEPQQLNLKEQIKQKQNEDQENQFVNTEQMELTSPIQFQTLQAMTTRRLKDTLQSEADDILPIPPNKKPKQASIGQKQQLNGFVFDEENQKHNILSNEFQSANISENLNDFQDIHEEPNNKKNYNNGLIVEHDGDIELINESSSSNKQEEEEEEEEDIDKENENNHDRHNIFSPQQFMSGRFDGHESFPQLFSENFELRAKVFSNESLAGVAGRVQKGDYNDQENDEELANNQYKLTAAAAGAASSAKTGFNGKAYLIQAMDLFLDARNVFASLFEHCSGEEQYKEGYEFQWMQICSSLKLARCSISFDNPQVFVVQSLLKEAKKNLVGLRELFITRKQYAQEMQEQQQQLQLLHCDLLIAKYFLLKAKMHVAAKRVSKAVQSLLRFFSLEYNGVKRQGENGEEKLTKSMISPNGLECIDPLDVKEALDLLKSIIKTERIPFSDKEITRLEADLFKVTQKCSETTEPYFFEVFFRDEEED